MGYSARSDRDAPLDRPVLIDRLEAPDESPRVVIDTDTYNEIDDQFALAYAILSDALEVDAVYAAPFHNERSDGPADGMARSYEEIEAVFNRLPRADLPPAYKGSRSYLEAGDVDRSPAVEDLISRARATDAEPLYVLALGAPTNVAAAIDRAPGLCERIVVVWLGGQPHGWHTADEFNLRQDLTASRILFDSGVPLVQVPCKNVAEALRVSIPELEAYLDGDTRLETYLRDTLRAYPDVDPTTEVWSKEIWDLAPVAYLVNPEWVPTHLTSSPWLSEECRYSFDASRHPMRVAKDVDRDAVLADVFETLS